MDDTGLLAAVPRQGLALPQGDATNEAATEIDAPDGRSFALFGRRTAVS